MRDLDSWDSQAPLECSVCFNVNQKQVCCACCSQLPCTMKDSGLWHAGRSFVEVRNEQETTLNRTNGNLTIRCALQHCSLMRHGIISRHIVS